jgi:hypothetical protein
VAISKTTEYKAETHAVLVHDNVRLCGRPLRDVIRQVQGAHDFEGVDILTIICEVSKTRHRRQEVAGAQVKAVMP